MAEQALIQFRADKELKQDVAKIYEDLGLDLPTAFRMFMKMSKIVNGIPFDVTSPKSNTNINEGKLAFWALRSQAEELPDIALAEINEEIAKSRKEGKANN